MSQDLSDDPPERPAIGARIVVFGVAGACVLGMSAGLWARPSLQERREGPPVAQPQSMAALSNRRLQIVVDDRPAPIGALLEVMPDRRGPVVPLTAAPPPAPVVLTKLDAPTPPTPVATPPALRTIARAEAPPVTVVDTEPKPKPRPKPKPKVTPDEPPVEKPLVEKRVAKIEKPAKPTPAKAEKSTKLAKAKPAPKSKKQRRDDKADKEIKLAKAERRRDSEPKAKADNKADRPTSIVRMAKAAPKKLKPKTEPVEAAEAKPTKKPAKPIKLAKADACAKSDPGEAIVCSNPRLGQRDRQLQRAYRDAEAAGVPASALRRQQERWIAARAAAAREAPWAVEDVYEARIAELNDLTRDARDY